MRQKKFLDKEELSLSIDALAEKHGINRATAARAKRRPDHFFWLGYHTKEYRPNIEWVAQNLELLTKIARQAAFVCARVYLHWRPGEDRPNPCRALTLDDFIQQALIEMIGKSSWRPADKKSKGDYNHLLWCWFWRIATYSLKDFILSAVWRHSDKRYAHPDLYPEDGEKQNQDKNWAEAFFAHDPFAEADEDEEMRQWIKEKSQAAQKALTDPLDRKIFQLACAGWDCEEIARIHPELTPAKVQHRIKRIGRQIRKALGIESDIPLWSPPQRNGHPDSVRYERQLEAAKLQKIFSKLEIVTNQNL